MAGLQSEHVMAVEWQNTQLQELDITATDLSTECLTDLLIRIQTLRWLSAGQQDGFNDSVSPTGLRPLSFLISVKPFHCLVNVCRCFGLSVNGGMLKI